MAGRKPVDAATGLFVALLIAGRRNGSAFFVGKI
jgi:hypothetical protein